MEARKVAAALQPRAGAIASTTGTALGCAACAVGRMPALTSAAFAASAFRVVAQSVLRAVSAAKAAGHGGHEMSDRRRREVLHLCLLIIATQLHGIPVLRQRFESGHFLSRHRTAL